MTKSGEAYQTAFPRGRKIKLKFTTKEQMLLYAATVQEAKIYNLKGA